MNMLIFHSFTWINLVQKQCNRGFSDLFESKTISRTIFYNKNPCVWLLWHCSSRGQLVLCNPLGLTASWVLSSTNRVKISVEEPIQVEFSKNPFKIFCLFVFIQHFKSKCSHLIPSNLSRNWAVCPRRSLWLLIVWCALSGPRDWTLRDWWRAWPTLTWLIKLVGLAVSSSVRNTSFPHTLKPRKSRASVG